MQMMTQKKYWLARILSGRCLAAFLLIFVFGFAAGYMIGTQMNYPVVKGTRNPPPKINFTSIPTFSETAKQIKRESDDRQAKGKDY